MQLFSRLILFSLLLASPFSPVLAASTDLANLPSGLYVLDPAHSSIVFRVSHLGTSYYTGRFDTFRATLDFDSQHPENSKLIAIIDSGSIDTHDTGLEAQLKDERNLNAGRFPRINFVAFHTRRTGPATGCVEGNLTMLGVAQPVIMNVTFNGWTEHFIKKTPVLGFSATGTLKRSSFGYTNLLPSIGDNVTFEIQAEFDKR
ncbi:MAG: YceI family protein [Alphaproteobacteria bacterium]|nr:YceI family protein [Alphaproteobacteria bacterium]